jgi:hypothetical protein
MSAVINPSNVSHLPDADMQAAPAALARAALRAREIAARTGTPLITSKDGKVIEEYISLPVQGSQGDSKPKQ